jgi:hypothetical protein
MLPKIPLFYSLKLQDGNKAVSHGIQQHNAHTQYSGPSIKHGFQATASAPVLCMKMTVTVCNRTGGQDHCHSISKSAVLGMVYQASAVFHYTADY